MHESQLAPLTPEPPRPSQPSLGQVAGAAGFRRVDLVRVIVGARRTTAEATGVLHRYPRTVGISLSTAGRLVAAGARLRIDHVVGARPG